MSWLVSAPFDGAQHVTEVEAAFAAGRARLYEDFRDRHLSIQTLEASLQLLQEQQNRVHEVFWQTPERRTVVRFSCGGHIEEDGSTWNHMWITSTVLPEEKEE